MSNRWNSQKRYGHNNTVLCKNLDAPLNSLLYLQFIETFMKIEHISENLTLYSCNEVESQRKTEVVTAAKGELTSY